MIAFSQRHLLALSLLALSFGVQAQTYRWTDQNGRVHYTDTPPPASAVKSEEKRLKGNVASSGDLPYATQHAMKNFPVKLYTTKECEPCNEGRNLLIKRGIPFSEVVVEGDAGLAELKRLDEAAKVPVLAVGTDVRKGYEAGGWNKALDIAGYPPTATPRAKLPMPNDKAAPEAEMRKGPYATQ